MKNFRLYGNEPYEVAVVHGGPGCPGAVAPVARELSRDYGVLEPLQMKDSVNGQVEELAEVLIKNAERPVILVGHSWGATLCYITTTRYPELVKKLILIGAMPLEWKHIPDFTPMRLGRLSEEERVEFLSLTDLTWDGAAEDKSDPFSRLVRLITKAESYALLPFKDEVLQYQLGINMTVGREIRELMESGGLLKAGRQITCPVVAISGENDPHSAELIRESLSCVHEDFKFILLKKCGHTPWLEKYARERFFEVLREEIA